MNLAEADGPTSLKVLVVDLEMHIQVAENLLKRGRDEAAYHYVFNVTNEEIRTLYGIFGEVDYYIPDTSYEEDARAKIGQMREYIEILRAALGMDDG